MSAALQQKKIRESEALYRLLTEDVLDVVWKTDQIFYFTYISPADEVAAGYKADEVIGHHVFEDVYRGGIATITAMMQQRQEAEQNGAQFGHNLRGTASPKGRQSVMGRGFSTAERDESSSIIGYHGITREITKRKQMEDQVHQLVFYDALTNLPNRRFQRPF